VSSRALREREYWNRARADGEAAREPIAKYYAIARARLDAYRAALTEHARAGARMLELGCSNGDTALELARLGGDVVGIDISDVAIARAAACARAEDLPNARFEVGDATVLDYADACFDVVFGSSIVHHLDVAAVAREIGRVTRDDGAAIFLEPLGHNPLIDVYRRLTPAARTPDERPLRRPDLETLGRGWGDVKLSYHDFLTLSAVPFRDTRSFRRLTAAAARLDTSLFRIPGAWRLAWFVLVRLERPRRTR
jgi:SAM-dependent methyltransferase